MMLTLPLEGHLHIRWCKNLPNPIQLEEHEETILVRELEMRFLEDLSYTEPGSQEDSVCAPHRSWKLSAFETILRTFVAGSMGILSMPDAEMRRSCASHELLKYRSGVRRIALRKCMARTSFRRSKALLGFKEELRRGNE
jgi:hypothetical protein